MTEKLFYKDPYLCEAEARVVEVLYKEDKVEVILDKTPFYPEGGGQANDLGFIEDIPVTYVYEEEEIIYHVMDRAPSNSLVKCRVDYNRRRDHIQQHSGEHLLSAAFFKLYNAANRGFHLGEDYVTIDIDLKEISEDMINAVEERVNEYIYTNLPVTTFFTNKEEANKLPMRKEVNLEGNVRIVNLGDMDYCACCGTHVVRTGEIGLVKIIKTEKNKGMTRVYFNCGERAIKDYRKKQQILNELNRMLSIGEEDIVSKINAQKEELIEVKKQLLEYKRAEAFKEAEVLETQAENKIIFKIFEEKKFEFLEQVYDFIKEKEYILILASGIDNQLMFAHNGSFSLDCGKIFKENIKAFNGKGGGNSKRAQGRFEQLEDLDEFCYKIRTLVETL